MNVYDIVKYGNLTFLGSLTDLKKSDAEKAGACGIWSVKNIVSHITSFELLLPEIIHLLLDKKYSSEYLKFYLEDEQKFNDQEVRKRSKHTLDEAIEEYNKVHKKAVLLLNKIPKAKLGKVEAIPWYGKEYSFEDLIVYMYYGHKREHSAQIGIFRGNLN